MYTRYQLDRIEKEVFSDFYKKYHIIPLLIIYFLLVGIASVTFWILNWTTAFIAVAAGGPALAFLIGLVVICHLNKEIYVRADEENKNASKV